MRMHDLADHPSLPRDKPEGGVGFMAPTPPTRDAPLGIGGFAGDFPRRMLLRDEEPIRNGWLLCKKLVCARPVG